jgi:hypothetical protein
METMDMFMERSKMRAGGVSVAFPPPTFAGYSLFHVSISVVRRSP